jgi:hypothetical protein
MQLATNFNEQHHRQNLLVSARGKVGQLGTPNQRISPNQKSFMPVGGCAEHNFILQSIVVDARRNGKQCCIASLDLTNAFGSDHITPFSPHSDGLASTMKQFKSYVACTTVTQRSSEAKRDQQR